MVTDVFSWVGMICLWVFFKWVRLKKKSSWQPQKPYSGHWAEEFGIKTTSPKMRLLDFSPHRISG